jgi:outer membrane usher protein FimD/PapC
MGHSRRTILLIAILVLAAMPIAKPAAASTFDGQWSVQIASSNSACGNGATVSIGISQGQIASTNTAVSASGRVADAGNINVSLTSGIKHATGFGHLSGTSGSGTWRGPICSGTWTAQRI